MKAGIATLFGRSNVGKSTLLNALVGTKLAITTPKPQTTRTQIQGAVHTDEGQIVFVDTPGIFTTSRDVLTRSLNKSAEAALQHIDVIIHVVDPTRAIGPEDKRIFSQLELINIPKILVINKSDLYTKPYVEMFKSYAEKYHNIIELSAKSGAHTKSLINSIFEILPDGEAMYEKGQFTNIGQEFWFAELIREKLFLRLREELPYSIDVTVDEIKERKDGTLYVHANILTTHERYKSIIIGAKGRGIKEIGQSARRELEQVTNGKIFLDLEVVVDPHWTTKYQ